MRKLLAVFLMCSTLLACVTDIGGYIAPNTNLDKQSNYYVVVSSHDERGLNELLVENMASRGYKVSSGVDDNNAPEDTNYILKYAAQWQWDITWYLLNLDLKIYHSGTRLLAASAHSQRTSLVRKPPVEIVAETLDQLF